MTKKLKFDMGPIQRKMFKTEQQRVARLKQELENTFASQVKRQQAGEEPSLALSERIKKLRIDMTAAQEEAKRIRQMPRFENVAELRFSLAGEIAKVRKHLG